MLARLPCSKLLLPSHLGVPSPHLEAPTAAQADKTLSFDAAAAAAELTSSRLGARRSGTPIAVRARSLDFSAVHTPLRPKAARAFLPGEAEVLLSPSNPLVADSTESWETQRARIQSRRDIDLDQGERALERPPGHSPSHSVTVRRVIEGLKSRQMMVGGDEKEAAFFLNQLTYGGSLYGSGMGGGDPLKVGGLMPGGDATSAEEQEPVIASRGYCPSSRTTASWVTIDCHLHLLDFLQKSSGTFAALKAMDGCQVERAVVFGMPCCKKWCFYRPEQPLYYQACAPHMHLICIYRPEQPLHYRACARDAQYINTHPRTLHHTYAHTPHTHHAHTATRTTTARATCTPMRTRWLPTRGSRCPMSTGSALRRASPHSTPQTLAPSRMSSACIKSSQGCGVRLERSCAGTTT